MPALGQRDPDKEKFWRDHIESWKSSGMSKSSFCQSKGLRLNSFCNWERIIRQRDIERRVEERRARRATRTKKRKDVRQGSQELFVPLNMGSSKPQERQPRPSEIRKANQIDILVPGNGLILRVGNDFDAALLHDVLDALRGWTC